MMNKDRFFLGLCPTPRGVFARLCRLFELASLKNMVIDYIGLLNAQPIKTNGSPFRAKA